MQDGGQYCAAGGVFPASSRLCPGIWLYLLWAVGDDDAVKEVLKLPTFRQLSTSNGKVLEKQASWWTERVDGLRDLGPPSGSVEPE